jgi:hypothetical protein
MRDSSWMFDIEHIEAAQTHSCRLNVCSPHFFKYKDPLANAKPHAMKNKGGHAPWFSHDPLLWGCAHLWTITGLNRALVL